VALAVANRDVVTISFDPFNTADPAMVVRAPLFRAGLRAGDRRRDHRRRRGLAPADKMAAAPRAGSRPICAPRARTPTGCAASSPPATRRRRRIAVAAPAGGLTVPWQRRRSASSPPPTIAAALTYPALVEALKDAFRGDITVPLRHHHTVPQPGRGSATLLAHAGLERGRAGRALSRCRSSPCFPDNAAAGQPSLHGGYLLMSGATGAPLALMDGRRYGVAARPPPPRSAATYLGAPGCGPISS